MKVLCVLLSCTLLGQTFGAVLLPGVLPPKQQRQHFVKLDSYSVHPQAAKVGLDLCPTCVSFTGQAINQLLNLILNAGVVGTCGALCGALGQATGSQVLGEVCSILCDIVGIEEFVKLVEKADLDPIYFCELLGVCAINDNGDAKIDSFTVTPKQGPQGPFEFDVAYSSNNGTGTGEVLIEVDTVDGLPISGVFLRPAQKPGSYGEKITLKAEPNPDCDPTQGPCETWQPGDYTAEIVICNGECGSKHPHSAIYDRATTNFTITG